MTDTLILKDLKAKEALYNEDIKKIKAELSKMEYKLKEIQRLIELVDKHGFFG